jgi:hypothetical protein
MADPALPPPDPRTRDRDLTPAVREELEHERVAGRKSTRWKRLTFADLWAEE